MVAKQIVWLSGLVPFEQVEQIMREIGKVNISQSSAWRLASRYGSKLKAVENLQQARLFEDGEMETCRTNQANERMGASMDGTMIHIREEGWKELKVGCVFDIEQNNQNAPLMQGESKTCRTINNSYVAHLGTPTVFGRKLWTEAHRRDWEKAKETLVIGDGAPWIWNLTNEHFYESHQLVDWYHATEHLSNVSKIINGEDTPIGKRWFDHCKTILYLGRIDHLVRSMNNKAEKQPHKKDAIRKEVSYFQKNKMRMNYQDMHLEGFPIGSGTGESAGKQYKARFCCPGMHWSRKGAENLLPIRTAILSKCFDLAWKQAYTSPPN